MKIPRTVVFTCALFPASAWAQDPPAGTGTGVAQASSGSTELGGQGAFQKAEEPADIADATELGISLGGILATGNANQAALTGALNTRIRRTTHQFTGAFLGNYGASRLDQDSGMEPTVGNVQGRVRYDYFFAKRWSVFGMVTARHDPFQQLALRLNVDPGFAFYILRDAKHRFWTELGYDYQFDLRTPEGQAFKDADGNFLDDMNNIVEDVADAALDPDEKTRENHAARLFVGYSNHLNDRLSFDTGLEYLQSVIPGNTQALRVNFDAGLTASISQKFSFATTLSLRYDNDPLPEVRRLDTITAINLVYRLL